LDEHARRGPVLDELRLVNIDIRSRYLLELWIRKRNVEVCESKVCGAKLINPSLTFTLPQSAALPIGFIPMSKLKRLEKLAPSFRPLAFQRFFSSSAARSHSLCFMGTDEFAAPILNSLIEDASNLSLSRIEVVCPADSTRRNKPQPCKSSLLLFGVLFKSAFSHRRRERNSSKVFSREGASTSFQP
jgi:hypothetical protein